MAKVHACGLVWVIPRRNYRSYITVVLVQYLHDNPG